MALLKAIVTEFLGLFIDDGALALLTLAIIGLAVIAIKYLGLSPMLGGAILLLGYLAILGESVFRYARAKNKAP